MYLLFFMCQLQLIKSQTPKMSKEMECPSLTYSVTCLFLYYNLIKSLIMFSATSNTKVFTCQFNTFYTVYAVGCDSFFFSSNNSIYLLLWQADSSFVYVKFVHFWREKSFSLLLLCSSSILKWILNSDETHWFTFSVWRNMWVSMYRQTRGKKKMLLKNDIYTCFANLQGINYLVVICKSTFVFSNGCFLVKCLVPVLSICQLNWRLQPITPLMRIYGPLLPAWC